MRTLTSTRLALTTMLLLTGAHIASADSPTPTTLTIAVNPTSITTIGSATVTATVTPNTGTIECGKGAIQYQINNLGWQMLANNLVVSANQFSATFDATTVSVIPGDHVMFRAGYESSGTGCEYQNSAIGQSPTVQLDIVGAADVCPNGQVTGVHLTIGDAAGNGTPRPGFAGTWSFNVNVLACEDVYNVTAQGGADGWAPAKSFNTATGSVQQFVKNKNTVYLWTIGNIAKGDTKTLTITVGATLKNGAGECGTTKVLNGDWSAMYAEIDGGVRFKSDYTDYKSTITVTCP